MRAEDQRQRPPADQAPAQQDEEPAARGGETPPAGGVFEEPVGDEQPDLVPSVFEAAERAAAHDAENEAPPAGVDMDGPLPGSSSGVQWIPGSIASPRSPDRDLRVAAFGGGIDLPPAHWANEQKDFYDDIVGWFLNGAVTSTMEYELMQRLSMIFALAQFAPWHHVAEVDAREDGYHFALCNMAQQPRDLDVPSWSYEVLGVHATDARGALCILKDQRIRGSETLRGLGFWCLGTNNNTSLDEQWRVARNAASKPRNQCNLLFGAEGRMQYIGLDNATHELEASYNERGIATHLRRDGRVAMPISRSALRHLWVFKGPGLPELYLLRNWH